MRIKESLGCILQDKLGSVVLQLRRSLVVQQGEEAHQLQDQPQTLTTWQPLVELQSLISLAQLPTSNDQLSSSGDQLPGSAGSSFEEAASPLSWLQTSPDCPLARRASHYTKPLPRASPVFLLMLLTPVVKVFTILPAARIAQAIALPHLLAYVCLLVKISRRHNTCAEPSHIGVKRRSVAAGPGGHQAKVSPPKGRCHRRTTRPPIRADAGQGAGPAQGKEPNLGRFLSTRHRPWLTVCAVVLSIPCAQEHDNSGLFSLPTLVSCHGSEIAGPVGGLRWNSQRWACTCSAPPGRHPCAAQPRRWRACAPQSLLIWWGTALRPGRASTSGAAC